MFSKDSARQADACRFCWMCRHICPVAGSTGNEAWTPRARGLMISMIERGTEFDRDIASAMYHCTLCDACANDCVTGYKPSEFTREARMRAVVEDLAPAAVIKSIETISECGNIFGLSAMGKVLDKLPEKADVLLFLGQTAGAMSVETGVHAVSILKKAGVDFTVLSDEPASGAYLGELMGYTGDVQAVALAVIVVTQIGVGQVAVVVGVGVVVIGHGGIAQRPELVAQGEGHIVLMAGVEAEIAVDPRGDDAGHVGELAAGGGLSPGGLVEVLTHEALVGQAV